MARPLGFGKGTRMSDQALLRKLKRKKFKKTQFSRCKRCGKKLSGLPNKYYACPACFKKYYSQDYR